MAQSPDPNCEFCQELGGLNRSRFDAHYPEFSSRIVAQTEHFVALPTLGQIFEGSLLVLPRRHYSTCGSMPDRLRAGFCEFVRELFDKTTGFGNPVIFEHGARPKTGGSCGIYHAHLHIVPLPGIHDSKDFFSEAPTKVDTLEEALNSLSRSDHYLLFGNEKSVRFADVSQLPFTPPSQYFRRQLANHYGLSKYWDWRKAPAREAKLVNTLTAWAG
jgi:diadenosine tetraphosphate (Ap4A) HIT family hydrolase